MQADRRCFVPGCHSDDISRVAFDCTIVFFSCDVPEKSRCYFSFISSFLDCLFRYTKQLLFRVHSVVTARCYASAVLAMGLCPSVCVCLSVCLSVTSRCSTKTAKRRITQITSHDTPGTLVFWYQRSPRNSTGVTPY